MPQPKATRRTLLAAAGTLAMPAIVRAQGVTEVEFYFPVAVGGPIPKIIDGLCADFGRENPSIRMKPIYAGTYVDTLTKAITATTERCFARKCGRTDAHGWAMLSLRRIPRMPALK